jgi:predicted dehydrogenase
MNIVILGCGAVAEQCHRKPLAQVSKKLGCRVVGLVDSNPSRLALARSWFPTAETFGDVGACFAKINDVSLTIVTSPPPLHAAHAEAAVLHGSHVLCEKPLAGSMADAERMVNTANRHGKILSLGMTRRYYPCYVEARRRIQEGALGDNLTFLYRAGSVYRWPITSSAPFRRESSGGGVLLDMGVHALDSLQFLFGAGEIGAAADDGTDASVEANSVVTLRLERAKGHVQLSWDMNLNNGLHIVGSEGQYWIPIGPLGSIFSREQPDKPWQRIMARADWPLDLEPRNGRRGFAADHNECFLFQLIQTMRAIKLGERPAASGEEGLSTMRLINSAYDMATPLNKPWLSAEEQAFEFARHWRQALTQT